jgi:hypothetical protein
MSGIRDILKVVLLVAGIAGHAATAQVHVGPIAAWSWAGLPHDGANEFLAYDTDTKFGGGVRLEFGLGPRTSLLLEPTLVEKGARGTSAFASSGGLGASYAVQTRVQLKYLELPILLRYSFTSWRVRPYVLAGGAVGYLGSARVRTEVAGGSDVVEVTDDLARVDIGVVLGLGASVDFGPARCFVEGRFVQGLVNLDKSGETTVTNQSVGVVAGVAFRLSGN